MHDIRPRFPGRHGSAPTSWQVLAVAAAVLAVPAATEPAGAQAVRDSATVIVRLGTDTIAVESWVRTADRLEAVGVGRTPRTALRRYAVRFGPDGAATGVAFGMEGRPLEERTIDPPGALPLVGGFYAPFAAAVTEASRAGGDSFTATFLVGNARREIPVRRIAPNTFALENQFGQPMEARVAEDGRVVAFEVEGGTTVRRVGWLDVEAVAREFTARDERGEGLGPLSPRETTEAAVHGAAVRVDYGRPSARGRAIMGGLVPFGELWRTGANEATRLETDRPLRFGDTVIEPGAYSLFTVPGRDRWELVVNRQTGQQGLQHDPAQDVARVPLAVRELPDHVERFTILVEPDAEGGVLRLRWERTEAYATFRVGGGP